MGPVDLLGWMLIAPVLIAPSRITEVNPFFCRHPAFLVHGHWRWQPLEWDMMVWKWWGQGPAGRAIAQVKQWLRHLTGFPATLGACNGCAFCGLMGFRQVICNGDGRARIGRDSHVDDGGRYAGIAVGAAASRSEAEQQALELKVARFTELARAVHAHKGKVLIVDVWHRT